MHVNSTATPCSKMSYILGLWIYGDTMWVSFVSYKFPVPMEIVDHEGNIKQIEESLLSNIRQ